ncbi:MAG: hypothetical protein RLY71_3420 [Pseudomonadota bacterium]|jgi:hypothetical protein
MATSKNAKASAPTALATHDAATQASAPQLDAEQPIAPAHVSGICQACSNEAGDLLTARTAQLSALMHLLTGDGFENFQTYNNEIQHNVLWLVSDLAQQIDGLAVQVVLNNAARAS